MASHEQLFFRTKNPQRYETTGYIHASTTKQGKKKSVFLVDPTSSNFPLSPTKYLIQTQRLRNIKTRYV